MMIAFLLLAQVALAGDGPKPACATAAACLEAAKGKDLALLERACGLGSAEGCLLLGRERAGDYARAVGPLQSACDLGSASGCFDFATLVKSNDVEVKDAAAKQLAAFRKACDLGKAEGCAPAGRALETNDVMVALVYFGKGCDGGDGASCLSLAQANLMGKGVEPSPKKAMEFMEKACKLGVKDACSGK